MIVAKKTNRLGFQATMQYFLSKSSVPQDLPDVITFQDDSELVDGIGGVTWDGSFMLTKFVESCFNPQAPHTMTRYHVVELGCGTGIASMVTAILGFKATATDRSVDLAIKNISNLKRFSCPTDICAVTLDWGSDRMDKLHANTFNSIGYADLLLGAEITCLQKQQHLLVPTIAYLAQPSTVILLTFDECATSAGYSSSYEKQFNELMLSEGFCKSVIFSGSIEWHSLSAGEKTAILVNLTSLHFNDLDKLAVLCTDNVHGLSNNKDETKDSTNHHISAFYKPAAINTCTRCNKSFFSSPLFNHDQACNFHEGYYVCRKHPAEIRCSLDGHGDSLGYYGNGVEDWAAEFWDCCGSEDPQAKGCKFAKHCAY